MRILTPVTLKYFDSHLHPPRLQAVENGDEATVRLLLAQRQDDVDLNDMSDDGQTPLSLAARTGHDTIVQQLLKQDGVDLECKCVFGRSPLSWAAGNGHAVVVQRLLGRGANPNSKSNNGRTPLWWAAWAGHEAVTRLLLKQEGIDLNLTDDEYGSTPLAEAAEYGHEAVVRLLLEKGADVKP